MRLLLVVFDIIEFTWNKNVRVSFDTLHVWVCVVTYLTYS